MMFAVIQFCVLLAMSLALPVPDSLLDSTQYFQITAHHVDSVAKYEGFYLSSYAHAPKSGIAYGAFGPGNSTATTCHLVGDVTDFSDHTTELSCDMGYLTVNHFSLLTGNEFPLVFNGTSGSKVIYLDNGLLKVNRPEFDGFYGEFTTRCYTGVTCGILTLYSLPYHWARTWAGRSTILPPQWRT